MLTRQQLKKSQGRTSDRFSLGELSALLDDDSDGHRLAEFLLKKNGGTTRPKRVFAAYKPDRFSIDVRTEKIKTPTEQKNASPKTTTTANNTAIQLQCEESKKQQETDEAVPLHEHNNAAAVPILPTASPTLQTVTEPDPKRHTPSERLSTRRSGGGLPSADRLRRFSLKRLSTLSAGRKLLKEFDSTVTDSNFLPPICSTPMTHLQNIPVEQSCNNKQFENIPVKGVESGAISTIPSSATGTHIDSERMLNSLRQHDAVLNNLLEHDSDTTLKKVHEKENLYRNTANTTPLPVSPEKPFNQRSRPNTPVYEQHSRPSTPVYHPRSRSTTPVSVRRSRPATPVCSPCRRSTTPVFIQRSRPTTPVFIQRSRPTTPVNDPCSCPTTPVCNQHSCPTTPVSTTRRRTYTVEKGSQPGQVVLTPAKSPQAPEQQEPTSTVEDGILELPSSPVEEAVYALHTINLVSPDSPTTGPPLPAKPLVASPKVLRVMQRLVASKSPAPALKGSSTKKSRIPLMTSATKLKCKKAHVAVPNTPENNVHIPRTYAIIPETQEEPDEEIPETQELPAETQKILETLRNNQSVTPMIVIPIHQTFNHTPTHSHETTIAGHKITPKKPTTACPYFNDATTTPINVKEDTTMRELTSKKAKEADADVNESILVTPTPDIIPNEDELRLCDILTDDEEEILPKRTTNGRLASNDDCQLECSNAPLNLASQPQSKPQQAQQQTQQQQQQEQQQEQQQSDSRSSSATRSRRLRKRSTTRRTQQQQQTKLSPLLSTETESEVGPPRAHPIITRRTSTRQRRKIPLNAAPSSPINGERFAVEMKTHLARLNNHEILDLRKRNSLGKVFAISGRRKSSLSRKSSLNAKQALEQQLQLEEEIELEILRRTLNSKDENLHQHSSATVLATDKTGVEPVNDVPHVPENDETYELPNEETELLHTIPPAPADFRDNQNLTKSIFWQMQENHVESSLIDDDVSNQVKFVSQDVSQISARGKATKRRAGRRKKPVPEVMQKYLEVHNRTNKSRNYANQSKRSLFSQETELSYSENSSFEHAKGHSPPTATPRVEQQEQQQLENTTILATSKRLNDHPLPPPDSFADELQHTTAAESMAVSTVAGTSIVNDTDNNVFKKPQLPAPKKKQNKKTTRDRVQKKIADDTQRRINSTTPQENNNDDVLQSNTAEPHDETSTVRRSKRGPKPLKNYWSFRSNDPTPLYDVAILEKRREESKKLRAMKLYNSKGSIASEISTIPTASSTINSTKKRGRQKKSKNVLGDSSSTSSSSVSSSAPRQKRLTMIQETESQSVMVTDQMAQDQNLGDNMFNRLDEVDISMSRTHKVSRTPQRNKSPRTLKQTTDDDVEKATKKKPTSKATKTATKEKKSQSKKSTKAAAAVAKTQKNIEPVINQQENLLDHADASETTQQMVIHLSTAAHLNDIFDKLKNGITAADTTPSTNPSNVTKSVSSTLKKSCRVRLPRVKASDVSKTTTMMTLNSRNSSKVNLAATTSQTIQEEDMGSNAPLWLRDISHVGSKIFTDTDKEKEIFEQMLCSQPGNLVLTDVDGLDYAYYENNKDIPFGYMRFQPNQTKRTKRARYYNLRFFVLSGKFKICTNKDIANCSEGSVVTILKGSSYSITNETDKLAILMVFKK